MPARNGKVGKRGSIWGLIRSLTAISSKTSGHYMHAAQALYRPNTKFQEEENDPPGAVVAFGRSHTALRDTIPSDNSCIREKGYLYHNSKLSGEVESILTDFSEARTGVRLGLSSSLLSGLSGCCRTVVRLLVRNWD
ncbi:hypothetical protein CEXT_42181 [Caerostris extrusa]|uniref:Uncharacterized protein n=1 Tax=Caerostris extrusa TaxID=172846 RepID=A0AAV4PRB5_CAEEX|nr:hypothetical protein CEXT_42181 [Caerostris extrusa]